MSKIDQALSGARARVKQQAGRVVDRVVDPLSLRMDRLEDNQYRLARELLQQRARNARRAGEPIRVLFLCHEGSLWGKVDPLFSELRADPGFDVDVVALPYRHPNREDGFHDGGAAEFLRAKGIEPIIAYDESCDHWIDLQTLRPDYLFYPTPYDEQYPVAYQTATTKFFARCCYVPYYGILIYEGEVEQITHRSSFFDNMSLAFVSTREEREQILSSSDREVSELRAVQTGAPMLDVLAQAVEPSSAIWNFPDDPTRTRVLWTPRWHIQEGTSHFLEYSAGLLTFVREHVDIDFVFRPHPLHFDNLVAGGYFSRSDLDQLRREYDVTENASIDESGSYVDTFLTSDVLVTDISSMLIEYFATGKPIIYTHRRNDFNQLGRQLATACYWVRTQEELDRELQERMSGNDPLSDKRQELISSLLQTGSETASAQIRNSLTDEF